MIVKLVWPSRDYLPQYIAALERGWSPDNLRGEAAAREQLAQIAVDLDAFLASLVDREAAGDPIALHLINIKSPRGFIADGHDLALIEVEVVDAMEC